MVRFGLLLILGGAFLVGCADENGSSPVVKVSASERDEDVNGKAKSTVEWLEKLSPADRQAAVAKSPQISSSLKDATDPALKSRIAALGL